MVTKLATARMTAASPAAAVTTHETFPGAQAPRVGTAP
jgi:hypothetical protein